LFSPVPVRSYFDFREPFNVSAELPGILVSAPEFLATSSANAGRSPVAPSVILSPTIRMFPCQSVLFKLFVVDILRLFVVACHDFFPAGQSSNRADIAEIHAESLKPLTNGARSRHKILVITA
jgi:hypothetical protein